MNLKLPIHQGSQAMPPHLVLNCRKTQKGAYTGVVMKATGVTIKHIDESQSGRSWRIAIMFPDKADWVYVQDISNTGYHDCYRLYGDGHREPACNRNQDKETTDRCLALRRR